MQTILLQRKLVFPSRRTLSRSYTVYTGRADGSFIRELVSLADGQLVSQTHQLCVQLMSTGGEYTISLGNCVLGPHSNEYCFPLFQTVEGKSKHKEIM